ncbi:hypothetical protein FQA39_LY07830 [Lamprigera yunnana]|nr:hypothetical protein FQA39_LY07830 [Lamprigera yunnana]
MDSLLASYRRERQKTITMKSDSAVDCTYNSKWFAFKSMHFLMDKYKPRKTFDFDTNQNKNMVSNEQDNDQDEQEEAAIVSPNGGSGTTTTQSQPSTSLGSGRITIPPKKSKPEDPRVAEAYRILKDTYKSKIRDKSDAFGNNIASKHCQYSKRTKAYVEHYINNILFDADMEKFEFETSLTSTLMSSYSDSSQNTLLHSVITDQPPPNQVTTVLESSSQNTINADQQLHLLDNSETEETRRSLVY